MSLLRAASSRTLPVLLAVIFMSIGCGGSKPLLSLAPGSGNNTGVIAAQGKQIVFPVIMRPQQAVAFPDKDISWMSPADVLRLIPSALALHRAVACAARLSYKFDADDLLAIEPALARLDSAVASGEISAEQLTAWKAEGEAMSLDDLAQFALDELEKQKDVLGAAEQHAGA